MKQKKMRYGFDRTVLFVLERHHEFLNKVGDLLPVYEVMTEDEDGSVTVEYEVGNPPLVPPIPGFLLLPLLDSLCDQYMAAFEGRDAEQH